jgi:hypothetical protein
MFCPKCSQEIRGQESDVRGKNKATSRVEPVQFCSRCGLSLNGLSELVAGNSRKQNADSKRLRGVKQGAMLMLLTIILIPAYFLLAALFPPNDRLVESAVSDTPFEKISQAVLLTMFLVGLVRAAYAWFFQKEARPELEGQAAPAELPAATSIPVSGFGAWRANSGELAANSKGSEQ